MPPTTPRPPSPVPSTASDISALDLTSVTQIPFAEANEELVRAVLGNATDNEQVEEYRLMLYCHLCESLKGVSISGDWAVRPQRITSWGVRNTTQMLIGSGDIKDAQTFPIVLLAGQGAAF